MIGKQRISYQGTQKTAASSDALWSPRNFLAIVRQVKHRYLLLYEQIRSTLRKDFFYVRPTNQNELIGKINHSNDLKKVKRRSVSVDKVTYVYVYIYMCNILMKQWWLIVQLKTALTCDTTGFKCFCFQVKNLKRDKDLKLVVSHLSTDFTYTLNHYCLFIQRQYTDILTLFHVYITYIFICITCICIYIYIYIIYIYIYIYIYFIYIYNICICLYDILYLHDL